MEDMHVSVSNVDYLNSSFRLVNPRDTIITTYHVKVPSYLDHNKNIPQSSYQKAEQGTLIGEKHRSPLHVKKLIALSSSYRPGLRPRDPHEFFVSKLPSSKQLKSNNKFKLYNYQIKYIVHIQGKNPNNIKICFHNDQVLKAKELHSLTPQGRKDYCKIKQNNSLPLNMVRI